MRTDVSGFRISRFINRSIFCLNLLSVGRNAKRFVAAVFLQNGNIGKRIQREQKRNKARSFALPIQLPVLCVTLH